MNNYKSLNIYSEDIQNSSLVGSIKDNTSSIPAPNKDKILEYLKNGEKIAAYVGIAKDVFTGESIPEEWLLYTDGVYRWNTRTIYHYEKYNLVLLDEFVEYVTKKLGL